MFPSFSPQNGMYDQSVADHFVIFLFSVIGMIIVIALFREWNFRRKPHDKQIEILKKQIEKSEREVERLKRMKRDGTLW